MALEAEKCTLQIYRKVLNRQAMFKDDNAFLKYAIRTLRAQNTIPVERPDNAISLELYEFLKDFITKGNLAVIRMAFGSWTALRARVDLATPPAGVPDSLIRVARLLDRKTGKAWDTTNYLSLTPFIYANLLAETNASRLSYYKDSLSPAFKFCHEGQRSFQEYVRMVFEQAPQDRVGLKAMCHLVMQDFPATPANWIELAIRQKDMSAVMAAVDAGLLTTEHISQLHCIGASISWCEYVDSEVPTLDRETPFWNVSFHKDGSR